MINKQTENIWTTVVDNLDYGLIIVDKSSQTLHLNKIAKELFSLANAKTTSPNQYQQAITISNKNKTKLISSLFFDTFSDIQGYKSLSIDTNNNSQIHFPIHISEFAPEKGNIKSLIISVYPQSGVNGGSINDNQIETLKSHTNEYKQALYLVLENFGDGFWDYNIQEQNFTYSNKWKKLFGYHSREPKKTFDAWKARVHPDDISDVMLKLDAHINGENELYTSEHRIRCTDESYKWVIEQGKVIERNKNGEAIRLIASHTDISVQMHFQESLKQSLVKQQDLNELKTRFVSMASHEFRTPLATILLSIETLEAYWERMTKDGINTKITKIKNNVIFLKNVIENVLSLTHVESGKIKVKPANTDLVRLIKHVIDDFYGFKNTTHEINFTSNTTSLNILIDKQIIEQVLKNLISNSIKYSPNSKNMDITLMATEQYVSIGFRDYGIGIPEDDLNNLFTPFFRARNVTNIRGTGIGLSLTREFVNLHDGQIEVQSTLNEGSTFTIILPIKKE